MADRIRRRYQNIIVDTATGAVRFVGVATDPQTWNVIQKGSSANDFVAVAARGLNLAQAVTDFIRIRTWGKTKTVRFIRYAMSTMITGTCEPIQ